MGPVIPARSLVGTGVAMWRCWTSGQFSLFRQLDMVVLGTSFQSTPTQLNSIQPEITDAGVNTSMSASLCSHFLKNIINCPSTVYSLCVARVIAILLAVGVALDFVNL